MGVTVGIVVGFLGVGILLIPFIIQIYIGTKQENKDHKRALEAASGIMSIAIIFYVGGLILAGYFSGKSLAASGGKDAGEGGKFVEKHPALLMMAA